MGEALGRALGRIALLVALALLGWGHGSAWADSSSQSSEVEVQLGLSSEQKAQLVVIHGKYKNLKQDLAAAVARLRRSVGEQINSDTPNRASIEKGLQEIVQVEGRRQKVMVDEYFEVLAVLRPNQQRIFREHVMRHILRQRR